MADKRILYSFRHVRCCELKDEKKKKRTGSSRGLNLGGFFSLIVDISPSCLCIHLISIFVIIFNETHDGEDL